ncbi:MAG: hypothetical protein WCW56_02310 [Candidatus Paceibacterota bacterium]|jgi:hypothetical protein
MIAYAAVGRIALIDNIERVILDPLITLLFALAVMYFIWGLLETITSGDDSAKRKTGSQHIMWGLIGIFIMVTVYGILNVVSSTISSF